MSLETKRIYPHKRMHLSHNVGHAEASPNGSCLAIYSPEVSTISLLSETRFVREINLNQPVSGLSLSVDSKGTLLGFTGTEADRFHIRCIDALHQDTIQCHSEVVDVKFDGLGRLWTITRGARLYTIELRGAGDWNVLAESKIGDPSFIQGGACLKPGPGTNAMFVEVYSGQSEQMVYLCSAENGTLKSSHLSAMDGEQFVFISPNGRIAITLDHMNCSIQSFPFPFKHAHFQLPWPYYEEGKSEDERPGFYGCFIDDKHFLSGSMGGQLFLITLEPFCVQKEIQIKGHLPIPARLKYPTLSDIKGFESDLLLFEKFGSYIATLFGDNDRSLNPELVVLSIADFLQ